VALEPRFKVVEKKERGETFKSVQAFRDKNQQLFDGYFVFTEKRAENNFLFFNYRDFAWASTWFWKKFIGDRPTMDEYLLHVLVLLTLYYYDALFNYNKQTKKATLEYHDPDVGCLFDFTEKLMNRVAIIDYPTICSMHLAKLEEAFKGEEKPALGLDWIRRIIPLAEF
jgi:hypothetical protein